MNTSDFIKAFLRNKAAVVGLAIVLVVAFLAIFAPYVAPHDPYEQTLEDRFDAPGGDHVLGTDRFGRDVLSRLIYGSRISLVVGLIAVSIGVTGGLLLGLTAGYFGGRVDNAIMRVIDVFLAFPGILLAIAIMAVLGSSVTNVMIAIGITAMPGFARLVRGDVLVVREMEYISAAHAAGMSDTRIMFRHVLPNIMSSIIVVATLRMATAIITEAGLSFLGIGVKPPTPTWGALINEGRGVLEVAPWLSLSAGAAILITVLGFNLFGDGLRDIMDPRLRRNR